MRLSVPVSFAPVFSAQLRHPPVQRTARAWEAAAWKDPVVVTCLACPPPPATSRRIHGTARDARENIQHVERGIESDVVEEKGGDRLRACGDGTVDLRFSDPLAIESDAVHSRKGPGLGLSPVRARRLRLEPTRGLAARRAEPARHAVLQG